ncbi:MAG TPA: sugar transferase [Acidimicrobiia bacterium]|nr:sugar transferase [Acidimicrobiia bacterium]
MTARHRNSDRVKRAFDVVVAAGALVATSPIVAVTAVVVRTRLGRPVLFRQRRPGRDGEPFTMLKFRTMTDERDGSGEFLPDADRLTRLGRFLRTSSIDELPELVNVLRGEMSIVGPRPLLMEYLERYTPEQMRRHEVRPGITGLVQVSGRNALSWDEKFALDVWYVDHRSFLLDLRIVLRTFGVLFHPEGVSRPGHATTPNFEGPASEETARSAL